MTSRLGKAGSRRVPTGTVADTGGCSSSASRRGGRTRLLPIPSRSSKAGERRRSSALRIHQRTMAKRTRVRNDIAPLLSDRASRSEFSASAVNRTRTFLLSAGTGEPPRTDALRSLAVTANGETCDVDEIRKQLHVYCSLEFMFGAGRGDRTLLFVGVGHVSSPGDTPRSRRCAQSRTAFALVMSEPLLRGSQRCFAIERRMSRRWDAGDLIGKGM